MGGALMLIAAVAAVVWATLAPDSYQAVRHLRLGALDLEHWAADGLLAIFFFVAGLELKRELTVGSLAQPGQALVPVIAAVCGMVVPALIYGAVNLALPGGRPEGWAVPMATDIAFALAVLAVAAPGLPPGLRAFLLTLAIVDDLVAITVIAVVFTADLRPGWLVAAAGGAVLWAVLQRRRVDGWYLFLPLGVLSWICVLNSGVHATVAGVVLGMLTRSSATDPGSPLDRWEHRWRPVSAGVAVPVFALLAAGVSVAPERLIMVVREPVALGIVAGLVIGKLVGVLGGAYLTARWTHAELAEDLRWSEVAAVAVLAGVGFTVALLIADLAFAGDADAQGQAKTAVLIGSVIAALLAAVALRRCRARRRSEGRG